MKKLLLSLFLAIAVPLAAQSETYTFRSENPITIPIFGPADPGILYVEGVPEDVVNITLRLFGYKHRFTAETMVALTNPNGFTTLIWASVSCRVTAPIDLEFIDGTEENFRDNCSTGTYLPGAEQRERTFTLPIAPKKPYFAELNQLIEADGVDGRWLLWSEDFSRGDGGEITSWEIIFETASPPVDE